MAKNVVMPALGMAQDDGVLLRWFKHEGDAVEQYEPLMEIETDKATVEIEAPVSGILRNVTAAPGDVVPVGTVIAVIAAEGESVTPLASNGDRSPVGDDAIHTTGEPAPRLLASPAVVAAAAEHEVDLRDVRPGGGRVTRSEVLDFVRSKDLNESASSHPERRLASPKAKRLAAERGIDLASIAGSGPDGAVIAADIERAASTVSSPQRGVGRSRSIRRIMAERTTQSWTTAPHFSLKRDVSTTRLSEWRESITRRAKTRVTVTDLLVKLAAHAIEVHPEVNASWADDNLTVHSAVNVSVAVAVDDGLVTPVIHQANELSIAQIAERRSALVDRSRSGALRPEDIAHGTFTITNLGMFGIDEFTAVLNPPQAAILAVGRITDRVVPVDGEIRIAPMMTLTLTCDHRVLDGVRGARFLETITELIEEPLGLLT